MSRKENFFHGTVGGIAGGTVLPPSESGVMRRNVSKRGAPRPAGYEAGELASVSESKNTAWSFAKMSSTRAPGRPTVYETGRAPDARTGIEHTRNEHFNGGYSSQEWVSKQGWPVTGEQHIPPPDPWERKTGRQGTLPLDWEPVVHPDERTRLRSSGGWRGGYSTGWEANHPSMVAQRAEGRRVSKQEKTRTQDEAEAANLGRGAQKSRQQLLPGTRGMPRTPRKGK